jgi:hypothetical protein
VICGGGEEHPVPAMIKTASTTPRSTGNDTCERLAVRCVVIEELLDPSDMITPEHSDEVPYISAGYCGMST